MGAGIYLYARRRSQMALPHQQMSYILNYPGSAFFLLVFMMAGNLPLPALAYAVFPAAGLVAGVVMAHLLFSTRDRITISSSPFRLVVATLLVGALAAGVVTNLHGIGDAERLQAERIHWVQYAAFELPKSEREEFLQALVTKTEYLSRTGEKAELVAEAARELDASAGMIVRALYSGLDTLCVGEDEDLQIWHNAMTDVLPAAEQRRYVTQIEDVCAPAI